MIFEYKKTVKVSSKYKITIPLSLRHIIGNKVRISQLPSNDKGFLLAPDGDGKKIKITKKSSWFFILTKELRGYTKIVSGMKLKVFVDYNTHSWLLFIKDIGG